MTKWGTLTDKQKVDQLQRYLADIYAFQQFLRDLEESVVTWLEIIENKPNKKQ